MSPDPRALVDAVHSSLLRTDPGSIGDERAVAIAVRRDHPLLAAADVAAVAHAVTARAAGLGPLDPLLRDPSVSEVMVNGPGPVWVERQGRLEPTELRLDPAELDLLVERIVGPLGLRADRRSPIADARLPDGSRANVIVAPLAVDGTCITIRRFGTLPVPLAELCPPGVAELLGWAVAARANVVVSGGTGAGKTTLLNAIGALLPDGERLVTVEDTAEFRLPGAHVVRLEARPATADGLGAVGIRDLVRNALRMRPDRLLVGEVRGSEAVDMLWAMNTGHEGSLTTCHANSPADALRRLELMVLGAALEAPLAAVREQLTSALDLVVHVARLDHGRRGVVAVAEVVDPPPSSGRCPGAGRPPGSPRPPRPTGSRPARPRTRSAVVPVTTAAARLRSAGPVTHWRERRRAAARDAQLPEALERVAASLRAGRSLAGAIVEVAPATPEPLGHDLRAMAGALADGGSVEAAVAEWSAARTAAPSSDLDLAATALALGARTGGEVGRALDRVAATLRERRELRGEARALATQARASGGVLTVAPLVFALLVSTLEPGVVSFLLTTAPGLACLVVGLALDAVGALWMARIVERSS